MRKKILLTVIMFLSLIITAQTKTEPYEEKLYGEGSTKTTTVGTDEKLNKVVTVEIKDKGGVLKHRSTWRKDLNNKWTLESESFKPSGKSICKTKTHFDDDNKKITEREETDANGKTKKFTRTGAELKYEKTGETIGPNELKGDEEILRKEIKEIEEKVLPSLEPKPISCNSPTNTCRPKVEVFAGYSYLRGDYGPDKESFPAGGRVAAVYNLTNHIAVGIDASINSRKIGTVNLSRSFLMVEGKFVFGDMDDCDRKLFGNIRLLGGIGIEKYGSSSGSGPAFGAGAGVIHLITKKVAARIQVDHLSVKYEGAEKLNNNLRFSGGLVLRFGN